MNENGCASQLFHNSVASRVVGVAMCVYDIFNPQLALVNFFQDCFGFGIRVKSGVDDDGFFGFGATYDVAVRAQGSSCKHFRDHWTLIL